MTDCDAMPAQTQDRQPGLELEMSPRPETTPRFPAGRLPPAKSRLINGGDSGIGRATAVLFARRRAGRHPLQGRHQDAEETLLLVKAEGAEGMSIW